MLLVFGLVVSGLCVLVLALAHVPLSGVFEDEQGMYARYGLFVLPLVVSEIYFILLRSFSRSLHRTVQPTVIREFQLRMLQCILILVQLYRPMAFELFLSIYVGTFLMGTFSLLLDLRRAGLLDPGWRHRWLPRRLRRSMVTYSGYTLSGTVAGIVLGNVDQLMIGALLQDGVRYVAHYAVGFYFGSVIATPGRALAQAAMPYLADAWKRKDHPAIQDVYRRSALVQTVASGLLFTGLLACVEDLFKLLPTEYAAAAPVALVIGLAYLLNGTIGLSVGIIGMSRAYRMDAWTSLLVLGINCVLGFVLVRSLGMLGIAWATLISLVVVNAYRTWFLWKRFDLWPYGWRAVLLLPLMGAIGLLVARIPLTGTVLPDLALRGLLVVALYIAVAHMLGLTDEFRVFLRRVRSRVA